MCEKGAVRGGYWRHTSARNALSSSGSFTCETSKNLNCHWPRVSFATMRASKLVSHRSHSHSATDPLLCCFDEVGAVIVTLG